MANTEKLEQENKLLTGALHIAALGLYVFPIVPGQKRPAVDEWQEKSTADPDIIRAWWNQNPRYNIGIDCGKSGLIVLMAITSRIAFPEKQKKCNACNPEKSVL